MVERVRRPALAATVVLLLTSCCVLSSCLFVGFLLSNGGDDHHQTLEVGSLLTTNGDDDQRVKVKADDGFDGFGPNVGGVHRMLLGSGSSPESPEAPSRPGSGRGLNPSVVIIVVILTVVFLLSGFLHLLARCCGRVAPSWARREPTESAMSALHGQLQHLFQLHDAGVDQSFIDTLPVFPYKSISGLKEGTDCAVCLSEFEAEDRLRLLPKCKHAFHIDCIDTWLLSNSTCPLCRCALLSEDHHSTTVGTGGTGALAAFSDSGRLLGRAGSSMRSSSDGGFAGDSRRTSRRMLASSSVMAEHGGGSTSSDFGGGNGLKELRDDDHSSRRMVHGMMLDSPEIQPVLDRSESEASIVSVASVLSVKLGRVERRKAPANAGAKTKKKGRNGGGGDGGGGFGLGPSSSILRGRSYSMGSYEYVVDPANLQVIIAPTPYPGRGSSRELVGGGPGPYHPRHRTVFSDGIPELGSVPGTPADELFWATRGLATPEYGCESRGMMLGTPDFFNARTPDFITSRDGAGRRGGSRLNLGHLAAEASLVPRDEDDDDGRHDRRRREDYDDEEDEEDYSEASLVPRHEDDHDRRHRRQGDSDSGSDEEEEEMEEGRRWKEEVQAGEGVDSRKDWVSIDLDESRDGGGEEDEGLRTTTAATAATTAMSSPSKTSKTENNRLHEKVGEKESEESRVMAGLERFFGMGWRSSNAGLEKLAESMSRREKAGPADASSTKSRITGTGTATDHDHRSVSSRAFSFRFPVPESLAKLGRSSRRSLSDTTGAAAGSTTTTTTAAFETASKETTTNGFETASKESLAAMDTASSVGSFDSSWIAPAQQQEQPQQVVSDGHGVNHNENNQQAASLARKTIHWLMGRDRRGVQVYAANLSPDVAAAAGNGGSNARG